MARRLLAAALVLSMTILGGVYSPALGQEDPPRCFPRHTLLEGLAMHQNMAVRAGGIDAAGDRIEIVATPDGARWALIATRLVGNRQVTCILGGGENWRSSDAVAGQDS